MKTKHKAFSILLAVLLCVSMAISASAELETEDNVGIYAILRGSSIQDPKDVNLLNTVTSVKVNPDNAYLQTNVEYTDGINCLTRLSERGVNGATSFKYDFPIYFYLSGIPQMAYVAHCVQGGSQSKEGYACYTKTPIKIGQ